MSGKTEIAWATHSWNPVTGCSQVSPGCAHCYAKAMTERMGINGGDFSVVQYHPERLAWPRSVGKPAAIFVNSMSDLFHEALDIDDLRAIWDVILEVRRHRYLILTKRPDRMAQWAGWAPTPSHLWLGTSIENQRHADRADWLREAAIVEDEAHTFLSLEPLLGPVELDLTGIDWVIVGGESGPRHRPMAVEWATSVRDQCLDAGVPFFFKQHGGLTPKAGGRDLEGRTWDDNPVRASLG